MDDQERIEQATRDFYATNPVIPECPGCKGVGAKEEVWCVTPPGVEDSDNPLWYCYNCNTEWVQDEYGPWNCYGLGVKE